MKLETTRLVNRSRKIHDPCPDLRPYVISHTVEPFPVLCFGSVSRTVLVLRVGRISSHGSDVREYGGYRD